MRGVFCVAVVGLGCAPGVSPDAGPDDARAIDVAWPAADDAAEAGSDAVADVPAALDVGPLGAPDAPPTLEVGTDVGPLAASDASRSACMPGDRCGAGDDYCRIAACGDAVGVCTLLGSGGGVGPACGCDGQRYQDFEVMRREGIATFDCDVCPPPPVDCCLDDADCPASTECAGTDHACSVAGRCLPRPDVFSLRCWRDTDCVAFGRCVGAAVCGCGETCSGPDTPGSCVW